MRSGQSGEARHKTQAGSGAQQVGRQGVAYLLVGGGTALLELGLFQLLYAVLSLPVAPANVTATVVATACNFLLNRNVTFKSSSNPTRSLVLYCLLFAANTAISTFGIATMVGWGLPSFLAKGFMQCCVVLWNFVLYKKVIFA